MPSLTSQQHTHAALLKQSAPSSTTPTSTPTTLPNPQVLHHTRVNIEADFGELCEEHELRDKLATLEALCEEQGIADGDAAEAARCARSPGGWLLLAEDMVLPFLHFDERPALLIT